MYFKFKTHDLAKVPFVQSKAKSLKYKPVTQAIILNVQSSCHKKQSQKMFFVTIQVFSAEIAQLVRVRIYDPKVVGSIPKWCQLF